MNTFLAAPFSLSVGDEIVATVIATNAYGSSSISSDSSSGATVKKAPSKPGSAPTLVSQTKDTINVSWSAFSSNSETGGSPILSYNLVYDEGTSGVSFVSLIGESPYSTATSYSKGGLTTDTLYQFKVRAYNKYGWSDFSDVLTARAATRPDQVGALVFTI